MINCNIKINENKLEEFVRVLLPEHYDILDGNSEQKIYINVTENLENIEVETISGDNKIRFRYEKIGQKYSDQGEVMAKTSLMKLFGKEKDYKWGTLIGVRPTKIVGRFLKMGLSYEKIREILKNIYLVSDEKVNLLINIVKRQIPYLDKETIGIYIGIAYCPTKCTYCSFPAYLLKGKYAERYDEYYESLLKEIKEIGTLTKNLDLKISTIYIGGGTPSILSAKEIETLLDTVKSSFKLGNLKEFTFEAGRIDTLNEKKLEIIKNQV